MMRLLYWIGAICLVIVIIAYISDENKKKSYSSPSMGNEPSFGSRYDDEQAKTKAMWRRKAAEARESADSALRLGHVEVAASYISDAEYYESLAR